MGPILQVVTDTDRRGGQVFASDLHTALEALDESVRTIALAPGRSDGGLDFEALGPTRRHPATYRSLRKAIASSSIVVGHGSTTLPMCALAGQGLRTPFVYRQISQQRFWVDTPRKRLQTRLSLRATDQVIALWQGAADVLNHDFGVDPGHITIIPNGVPAERCPPVDEPSKKTARRRFGLDPHRLTLVYVGAFAPEKGADILVRAMQHPQLSAWQLLLVGAGPEERRLRAMARSNPSHKVTVHGPVSSGHEALAAADVVALTSRAGDSMPAVLIEAGLMGIPAVATPVEGIVDIVLEGRTGSLVSRDDPAATAAAVEYASQHAGEFGYAARAHCSERFEIGPVAHRWRTLLRSLSGPAQA